MEEETPAAVTICSLLLTMVVLVLMVMGGYWFVSAAIASPMFGTCEAYGLERPWHSPPPVSKRHYEHGVSREHCFRGCHVDPENPNRATNGGGVRVFHPHAPRLP